MIYEHPDRQFTLTVFYLVFTWIPGQARDDRKRKGESVFRFFTIIIAFLLTVNIGPARADCPTGYSEQSVTLPAARSSNASDSQWVSHLYSYNRNPDNDLSAGEWKVTWTSGDVTGTMKGIASCNSTTSPATMPDGTFDNSTDVSNSDAAMCWCQPTKWTPTGETTQNLSAAWMRQDSAFYMSSSQCAEMCANGCTLFMGNSSSRLWGMVVPVNINNMACTANTISINWQNSSGGTQESNSCTYGGALTTPATAPTKRGHTFTGWSYQ